MGNLSIISRCWKRHLLQKRLQDRPRPEYVNLAPIDDADKEWIYTHALSGATKDPNVSNIALTGPYGSGKSSIIETFLKRYEGEPLKISLAAFLPEADGSIAIDGESSQEHSVSKQEIERSILQQMLYGADANSLPLSRFKRIQSPKLWSSFVALFIVLGVFSCWHLFQSRADILSGAFFKPLDSSNWFNFISFAIGSLFLWRAAYHLYIKSFGISLKSISLTDIEITPESAKEESILNRHLDEIIYFFQSTSYDLVVVEDLDRFNNPEIFVTLREINSLVNANAGVKRKIRFLYALRDNMFVNTDRTKFFEFIVPVIPIINSSNSIDKVIEQQKRLSLDERLDPRFLREVSRYLNDLRLIQNIFNEYAIYDENLKADGESGLNKDKLLAILIYKNVRPSDFEDLHRGKGKLANIFQRHGTYIAGAENKIKAQISELEHQIDDANKQLASDLVELRRIYATAMIAKKPDGYHQIDFKGNVTPAKEVWNRQDFDELIEASEAAFRSPQNIRHRFDPKSLQMDVTTEITYQQRKIDVERKSSDYRASTSKKTRELRAKISSLRTTKFNELIRINAEETEELFEAFGENGDLMRFLVLEGFLDNNYYQYTSLFHSGRLSPSDNKFLNQIRSYINPEPDSQIDNPKEVIAAMREDDFRQNFVLNKTLVDCMFSSQGEYNTQIAKMTEFVASNFAECGEFFSTYYQSGVCVTELVSTLNVKWRGFVSAAIASSDNVLHVAQMIGHLPDAQLKALHTRDPSVSDFISENLSEILALGIDFEPRRLELIQFEIEDLGSVGAYPAIAQLLADSGKFQISVDNIEFVFRELLRSPATEDLQTKHYSTVLRSEDQGLINKIHGNFALYLKVVLLGSGNNTEEEISAIIAVINHDEIETEYLVEFVASQSAKLPSLEQVPTRLHSALFRLQKIAPSWENCLAYRESEEFDAATLTEFLERGDTLSALSPMVPHGVV